MNIIRLTGKRPGNRARVAIRHVEQRSAEFAAVNFPTDT
jgi:hypothetical protein